jgi:hypothetical protein
VFKGLRDDLAVRCKGAAAGALVEIGRKQLAEFPTALESRALVASCIPRPSEALDTSNLPIQELYQSP